MDVSCTIKFHCIIHHVREHIEDEIEIRPEEPRGLGCISTQILESISASFVNKFANSYNS